VQIDGFIDKDEFKKQIDEWIHVFRNTKPAPGTNGPLMPGDPGARGRNDQKQRRNSVAETGGDDLLDISKKTGISRSHARDPAHLNYRRTRLTNTITMASYSSLTVRSAYLASHAPGILVT
jgi:hypothetical protein